MTTPAQEIASARRVVDRWLLLVEMAANTDSALNWTGAQILADAMWTDVPVVHALAALAGGDDA